MSRRANQVIDTPHEGHVDITLANRWRLMPVSEDETRRFPPSTSTPPSNECSYAVQGGQSGRERYLLGRLGSIVEERPRTLRTPKD
jgi:hypothetical protein